MTADELVMSFMLGERPFLSDVDIPKNIPLQSARLNCLLLWPLEEACDGQSFSNAALLLGLAYSAVVRSGVATLIGAPHPKTYFFLLYL